MRHFTISESEARALLEELKKAWVKPENQDVIYKMLTRLENEIEK